MKLCWWPRLRVIIRTPEICQVCQALTMFCSQLEAPVSKSFWSVNGRIRPLSNDVTIASTLESTYEHILVRYQDFCEILPIWSAISCKRGKGRARLRAQNDKRIWRQNYTLRLLCTSCSRGKDGPRPNSTGTISVAQVIWNIGDWVLHFLCAREISEYSSET